MVEFSAFVSQNWNIPEKTAKEICEHFEKGDSYFYLCDYNPAISTELSPTILLDIFNCLKEIKSLSTKKKRLYNALKKANALDKSIEKRIALSTSSVELDDMLLLYRSNTRSRGQQAIKKGLAPLADIIEKQEIEEVSIEELTKEYIGKHSSIKTTEDVIAGVRDILVERFAYDETVRSMVREFGFESGFFEILPKNKKDKRFISYIGKMIPVNELTSEEYLTLRDAEKKKQIRFKHGVQLFHINELLRNHFIINPDFIGYDLICEVIDESWNRLLQQVVEEDVKNRIAKDAENWAIRKIEEGLQKKIDDNRDSGNILVVGRFDNKYLIFVALNTKGHLLSAAKEKIHGTGNVFYTNRVKQFYTRYRPSRAVINDNEFADYVEATILKSTRSVNIDIPIIRHKLTDEDKRLIQSEWMQKQGDVLEGSMETVYALGLTYLQPLSTISQIGVQYFSIHPLQKYVSNDRLMQLLSTKITEIELHNGIPYLEAPGSVLKNIECVEHKALVNIRKWGVKKPFSSKNDLATVDGVTELIFKNIAGYIIIPNAKDLINRTLIHPEYFNWINNMSLELNASLDSLIKDPERLRAISSDDFTEKIFIDKQLTKQLRVGQKYLSHVQGNKHRRRYRFSELKEGTVITGRVTNITKFGVFVDINAVCDGLIHISQLVDGYIENADQVVKQNEQVDVRILKVDKKKRRISLSMKKLGLKAPKIRPSSGQLVNLADYFKNR